MIWICGVSGLLADRADLGNDELERYFERRVEALESPLKGVKTLEEWKAKQPVYRKQLLGMLGLDPMPERTPLKPVVTGKIVRDEFTVENLHFQSSPGLYVTGNLYLPVKREGRVPAVLYGCGHAGVRKDGVSYGNKCHYQHHGIWFARNGYACLVIDTLQLGEIVGTHHGLFRHNRWWWIPRGYTPAGLEAWNCVRALDYLQSRPEIDAGAIGVTGRSGGGAYSWWIAAIDERIKVAVPVAGIASLKNHVVDGCVEGHCDCMYQMNSRGWDFEMVAALVAPRPLLISNTDKDSIFPLDGVYQVYAGVRRIYDLYPAPGNLGLNIEEGPHEDTQPLRTSAFHWMNRHLKGAKPTDTFELAAVKLFEPEELKVFEKLPADELNTKVDEIFVPKAPAPQLPKDVDDWERQKREWTATLKQKCFGGGPAMNVKPLLRQRSDDKANGLQVKMFNLETEPEATCWLGLIHHAGIKLRDLSHLKLIVLDDEGWKGWLENYERPADPGQGIAYLCARGIGAVSWPHDDRKRIQVRRRFALIGQTLDGRRMYDILQAVRALRAEGMGGKVFTLQGRGVMAGNALYAALLLDVPVSRLELRDLPASHREGPYYQNVLQVWDLPQAVAVVSDRSTVNLLGKQEAGRYAAEVRAALGGRSR